MNQKIEILDGIKYRYSSDWINDFENKTRWNYYWYQQKILHGKIELKDRILEIGVGSGFISNYLKSKGFNIKTFDIDKDKNPDIIANIVSYDFKSTFDHILAFEIFEHIPYDKFIIVLKKLKKVCKKTLFFSVPLNRKVLFRISLFLPLIKHINWELSIKKRRITTEAHFWELNYKELSEKKLINDIESAGFKITDNTKFSSLKYFILRPEKYQEI